MHINFEYFTFRGEKYAIGDLVEVSGMIYNEVDDVYEEFLMLGVQSMRKFEKEVDTTENLTLRGTGKVYYDATQQSLVIEDNLKIDKLEVFDAQGRCVMKANNPAGSVSVARLPRGLYLYRLTAPGTTLSGKFVR